MGGGGPRSTPTIADGDIYSLGAKGDLVCLDGTNGKPRWSVNVVADNGAKVVEWGMTSSPLIVGNLVVVNAGIDPDNNHGQAVAAYDRKTGTKAWAAGNHPAGYSSPMLAKLAGVEQIVLFDGGGVAGIAIADGKELVALSLEDLQRHEHHPATRAPRRPRLHLFRADQRLRPSAANQESGIRLVGRAGLGQQEPGARFANPVYHAGHIYGLSNNFLCLPRRQDRQAPLEGRRSV